MANYDFPVLNGPPVDRFWTMLVSETNGVVDKETAGKVTLERQAYFAYRADADAFTETLRAEGFETNGPVQVATRYFGPSDSPSNAWSVRGERAADG